MLSFIFGVFGYISLIAQWGWSLLIIGASYVPSAMVDVALPPTPTDQPIASTNLELPLWAQVGFVVVVVCFTLGLTLYTLYLAPKSIAKHGKSLTTKSATTLYRHSHAPKKSPAQKRRAIERISWQIKLGLSIFPLLLLLIPPAASLPLTHEMTMTIGIVLAAITLLWIGLQYMTTRAAGIDSRDII